MSSAYARATLPQPLRADQLQAGNAVGGAAAMQLLESWQLVLGRRDDDLAAALVRDAAFVAVRRQRRRALHAQACLQRSGGVVDARMDDAAVATGLMPRDLRLLVEHDEPQPWMAPHQGARHCETENARPDDGDVCAPLDRRGRRVFHDCRRARARHVWP
jgi:hypothetical protein